ncbi:T9SS type A sorting domain-containing protein [candidate division KSB1 bacterium]|nr:T9SS type A sorting domain-containing protein [candidate division KSB1 bacterium]
MLDRSGIPDALEDERALALYGGCDIHQRGSGGGLWWPSLGIDGDNNIYVTFTAPRPFDVDTDTVNYPDIYATASVDGGLTWGCPPLNVTDSQGTEDKLASMAKAVDDSIRFVYISDDVNGFIGGTDAVQTTPSSLLYLAMAAADIPTENTCATTVKEAKQNTPTGYSLEQNYPNPFNPRTEIRFTLANSDRVSLKIYNMMGQLIDTVVDDFMPAGSHSVNWIAPADLASGVYLYQLESLNFRAHKKFILMK